MLICTDHTTLSACKRHKILPNQMHARTIRWQKELDEVLQLSGSWDEANYRKEPELTWRRKEAHFLKSTHVILYTMQLKDGGSLAVVSGCPNRANGHTGVKGKAAQAALLQQCWEDICSRFKRYLLWNSYLMGHFSYLCEQLWPEVWEQIWACLFYDTTLMINTSQSP